MSTTLHESMTTNNEDIISQTNREVNNGQKVSVISMPFNTNFEENIQGVMLTSERDMEG